VNRLIAVVFFCFVILAAGLAQSKEQQPRATTKSSRPAAAEKKLLSKETVEASLRRTLGYDSSVSWEILEIRPSIIPGVTEVLVSVNKQQPNRLYISPDGRNAIVVADVIPFGPNPFAPARAKLQAADGPALGPMTPAISIVEFSDLQCPHCKAAQLIVEKLAADFPQVRIVFQQFPLPASLHPWAMEAAEYTDCAARGNPAAFWKYLDAIFENQGSIALATADDKLKELATAAGLDAEKIASCAAAAGTEARVKKSMALGQSLDVKQTPTFFINGRRVLGVTDTPYDQLKKLVQFEMDHAGK
jgi:protein-disulfide isomerase